MMHKQTKFLGSSRSRLGIGAVLVASMLFAASTAHAAGQAIVALGWKVSGFGIGTYAVNQQPGTFGDYAIADVGATAYAGTPDFLKVMMEKAVEIGRELKITKAIVGGGPLFPAIRQFYADNGISCVQGYGTADVGSIAFETPAMEGMTVDEGAILEIVTPGTGDPVAEC